ncbi:MAG: STAS domain-containing protein [Anaerolineales bacterium]
MVQRFDFFAEIPALEDQMPPARGVSDAVVVLVLRDVHHVTSTAIEILEGYTQSLKENGGNLMLADVNPGVLETPQRSGALDDIGAENVIPATAKVLVADNMAWNKAQTWIKQHQVETTSQEETPEE